MSIYTEVDSIYTSLNEDPPAMVAAIGELLRNQSEYVSLAEFSKMTGKSRRTILNYIDSGRINAENRSRGNLRPRYFIQKLESEKI